MFCPKCGNECLETANFCGVCGYKLTETLSDEKLQDNEQIQDEKEAVENNTDSTHGRKSMGRPKKKASEENSSELGKLKKQNEELTRKLKYAEMENEFLKKLDALVRERIERENGR